MDLMLGPGIVELLADPFQLLVHPGDIFRFFAVPAFHGSDHKQLGTKQQGMLYRQRERCLCFRGPVVSNEKFHFTLPFPIVRTQAADLGYIQRLRRL